MVLSSRNTGDYGDFGKEREAVIVSSRNQSMTKDNDSDDSDVNCSGRTDKTLQYYNSEEGQAKIKKALMSQEAKRKEIKLEHRDIQD
tara:strand:+ start:521 stop:781 length:261 start_codon:yes stop_codon:yes gene_type:complete